MRPLDRASRFCYQPPQFAVQAIARAIWRLPIAAWFEPENTGSHVQVLVRDNNVDQALRALKKKMQREGIFREMKMRGHYEKPSEKRAREKAEAVRRARKLARKRAQREGLLPQTPRTPRPGAPAAAARPAR
jgi:small subunit ribosomal protein S21